MNLSRNATGDSIAATDSSKWKHPWFTSPRWSAKAKKWAATVEPGFVDALDASDAGASLAPIFRATVTEQKDIGNPWENNPLTGRPFFSDFIFKQPTAEQETREVDLPLYLDPLIPLEFYGIGFDGDPAHEVPQFFLDRGAAKAASADAAPPKGLRLLRACDLWLNQPRLALTSDTAISPGTETGQSNVTQTLSVISPGGDALRILVGEFRPVSQIIDPLSGDFTEIDFDELLISTVYLLSPPDAALGSEPDGSWQSFVAHNLFWNLSWAQPQFRISRQDQLAGAFPVLAGGVAQHVINFLSASLNDAAQQAQNRILANSLAGHFWVCTGGGHTSTRAISATAAATNTGPDKSQNATAKAAALAAQRRARKLDPDFPYNARQFSLSLLSA